MARSAGSGARSWTQTWSAPASRCSRTRAAMAAASPWTTTASSEPVAAARGEVVVGPAEPSQVVGVVLEREVAGGEGAGRLPRPGRIGVEHGRLLDDEERLRPDAGPGRRRVLDGDEVRVRAGHPRRGELQHPGPQRREQDGRRLDGAAPAQVAASMASR